MATAWSVVAAPRAAFEGLRVAPTWGWAFLIAMVLGIAGTVLSTPAALHSVAHQMAVNPQYAQMSDAQRRQAAGLTLQLVRFGWAYIPFLLLLSALLQTVIMLIFNAAGRGNATLMSLWASAMNIAIPGFGLSLLATGVIAVLRGPDGYNSALDSLLAMPSLAWLFSHATPAVVGFLSGLNPFSIWAFFLTALAMVVVTRVSKPSAYLAAALVLLIPALIAMWSGARS